MEVHVTYMNVDLDVSKLTAGAVAELEVKGCFCMLLYKLGLPMVEHITVKLDEPVEFIVTDIII